MNKKFIISIVVLISLFGLVAFWPKTTCDASGVGCRPSSQSQTKQPKAEIIQSELQNNTALLIDVREPDEFPQTMPKMPRIYRSAILKQAN